MKENFIVCPVFNRIRFDEGGADSLLEIITFMFNNLSGLSMTRL